MTTTSTGVCARTEAPRGRLLSNACSPKKLPAPSVAMTSPALLGRGAHDVHLALLDHVETRRGLALPDDEVTGLEVRVRHALGDVGLDAAEVARKDQQPRPVEPHLHTTRHDGA